MTQRMNTKPQNYTVYSMLIVSLLIRNNVPKWPHPGNVEVLYSLLPGRKAQLPRRENVGFTVSLYEISQRARANESAVVDVAVMAEAPQGMIKTGDDGDANGG
ncbi:hypothetical protein ACOMHN_022180 [Nucella lapillus]